MKTQVVDPFGLEVTLAGNALSSVSVEDARVWVAKHQVVVLRDVKPPNNDEILSFGRGLGEILEWQFGAINELRTDPNAKNYLYTHREVPFHWDGAFVGRIPHFIFFHCADAGPEDSGGATLFCDTIGLVSQLDEAVLERWRKVSITYQTEKIAHYGGQFTASLIDEHPVSKQAVLRFAEPVEDLNPVRLSVEGIPKDEQPQFLAQMAILLRDPSVCYAHAWRQNDIVLADNFALLHGRREFALTATRHLRRLNVM
jgi:alpha-ketoglutarate-dependent taurine dioxygenase